MSGLDLDNYGFKERNSKIELPADIVANLSTAENADRILFTIEAEGKGIKYQWEVQEGDHWLTITNQRSKNFIINDDITPELNGKKFRCKVYNSKGIVYSNIVTLTVNLPTTAPIIKTQPVDKTVELTDGNSIERKFATCVKIIS